MKSTGLRRIAGTALAAVAIAAGTLAAAPSAAAKANGLAIDKVSFTEPNVQVKLTYSCDPGLGQELVAQATTLDADRTDGGTAMGVIRESKLVCDYKDHNAKVTLRPAYGTHFAKGDKVRVALYLSADDGSVTADLTAVTVL
ncbi:hypothetical protein [Streptomyces sp. NPDC086787]|uniref:hypothetical protein n=1 Tax=Streptomyces sp. NPDC086787 TaxID=3365759 RepID=UPI003800A3ED